MEQDGQINNSTKLIKFLIIALTSVFILGIFTYFLLFSPFTARYQIIISVRYSYMMNVYKIRKSLYLGAADNCWYFFQPIVPFRTTTERGYKYIYSLSGTLVSVDEKNDVITLQCGNKKYAMGTLIDTTVDKGWVEAPQGRNVNLENPRLNPFLFFENDIKRSAEKDIYYKENQLYSFLWLDSRELNDIYRDMKENPGITVNPRNGTVIGILR